MTAWALWALTMLGLAVAAWLAQRLVQAGRPEFSELGRQVSSRWSLR
jgi:hypothetical protein